MAASLCISYISRVDTCGGDAMFVGLGLIMMLVATYGLFAWQLSMGRILLLCVAGMLLVAAQFLRIQKNDDASAEIKRDVYGRRQRKEVQAPDLYLHRHLR